MLGLRTHFFSMSLNKIPGTWADTYAGAKQLARPRMNFISARVWFLSRTAANAIPEQANSCPVHIRLGDCVSRGLVDGSGVVRVSGPELR